MYSSGMGVGMVCQKAWRRANLTCSSNFAYSAFAYSKICMHINYIAYSQVLVIVRSLLSGVPLRVTKRFAGSCVLGDIHVCKRQVQDYENELQIILANHEKETIDTQNVTMLAK
jgi:hypothetical protein